MIVIGIGTGRCGTKSLACFLNRQLNSFVTHEIGPMLSCVQTEESRALAFQRYSEIMNREAELVGDVALYNIWWQDVIQEVCGDNVKWVCMKRDKGDTINSFIKKVSRKRNRVFNHWSLARQVTIDGILHTALHSDWDKAFPDVSMVCENQNDLKELLAAYYDMYYAEVEKMEDVFVCDVNEVFDCQDIQQQLLDYIGVENKRFYRGIKENGSKS